jgi:ABC-type transport system involved in cytochrome c biogenesis permease subunit
LDFTRRSLPTAGLEGIWSQGEADLATVLEGAPGFKALWRGVPGGESATSEQQALMRTLAEHLAEVSERGRGGPVLLAPHPGSVSAERWWRATDLIDVAFDSDLDLTAELEVLKGLQRLEQTKADPEGLRTELHALHALLVARAEARGEYRAIELEVNLYRWDPFTRALGFYLLAFLGVCLSLVAPSKGWVRKFTFGMTLGSTALLIFGIVLRCIIRQRPPVVSLYDTVLFITAGAVLMGLVTEWLTRQRIAIGLSTVLGTAGMFLAGRYELKEVASAGDTMASVVAVLDTNYYLAIHVTTITLGYAAGLLAGGLGHVWILGRLVGFRSGDREFYSGLTRMTYGVVCFGLLLSVFGTIMGGVWANDSWGRFWGWDPKENGALLICLWEIMILHARMGGYIRDRGLAVMAVLGAVVVSASWWGVNLLGVGLHSYGFTSGVVMALAAFWAFEILVVMAAGVGAKLEAAGK